MGASFDPPKSLKTPTMLLIKSSVYVEESDVDDFDREIKTEFINEALGGLEESEGAFLELESTSDTGPLLDRIFRLAHNLKGGSRAVGFSDVAEFTHQLENLVLKIQKGGVQLTSDVVSTLLRSNDRLIEMLSGLRDNMDARFQNGDLISEIESHLNSPPAVEAAVTSPQPEVLGNDSSASFETSSESAEESTLGLSDEAPPLVPDVSAFFSSPSPDVVPVSPSVSATVPQALPEPSVAVEQVSAKQANSGASAGESEAIRVSLQKIDVLNELVGELIVLQSVVISQTEAVSSRKLTSAALQVSKLAKNIQEISMGLRMLPVKPLVQKLQRAVRDTAKAVEKSVDLKVTGESMEVDKSVLDRIADPLIHILRNGVDHGIETSADRLAKGKKAEGTIWLTFENEGNNLVVTARDDGKGIDPEVIRKKAIEKGLISENQNLSERQIVNLIFAPGFSTKTETSEISGRGVGMDVVKTNVEQIGGQVEVNSKVGSGSHFRIQIPLSLSVIDGMIVRTDSGRYVIPLNQVDETVNLKAVKVFDDRKGLIPCFDLRGQIVPIVDLDTAIGSQVVQSSKVVSESREAAVLLTKVEGRSVGIRVSEILRSQQIVIKPLSEEFSQKRGWVGSCVLGDGLPTLILNPSELLRGKIKFGLDGSLAASVPAHLASEDRKKSGEAA